VFALVIVHQAQACAADVVVLLINGGTRVGHEPGWNALAAPILCSQAEEQGWLCLLSIALQKSVLKAHDPAR
jgi:hypothetical protein